MVYLGPPLDGWFIIISRNLKKMATKTWTVSNKTAAKWSLKQTKRVKKNQNRFTTLILHRKLSNPWSLFNVAKFARLLKYPLNSSVIFLGIISMICKSILLVTVCQSFIFLSKNWQVHLKIVNSNFLSTYLDKTWSFYIVCNSIQSKNKLDHNFPSVFLLTWLSLFYLISFISVLIKDNTQNWTDKFIIFLLIGLIFFPIWMMIFRGLVYLSNHQ